MARQWLDWRPVAARIRPVLLEQVEATATSHAGVDQTAFETHMDDQRDVLRDFAEANGIEFLDLLPVMQAAAAQGENLYWYADTHWREAGQRIAGETIADYIMSH